MNRSRVAALLCAGLVCIAAPALAAESPLTEAQRAEIARILTPQDFALRQLSVPFDATSQPGRGTEPAHFPFEFRTIDGSANNGLNPEWGAAGTPLLRQTTLGYDDGVDSPAGQHRASARAISNACAAQTDSIPNSVGASDFLWQWGQFLDHDMDLSNLADPSEEYGIGVPAGDPFFDPDSAGDRLIGMTRSAYMVIDGVRQQVNAITAYIDGSNVYGSDLERADELRAFDGKGRLKSSPGYLLPFNVNGFPNAMGPDPRFFLAGDERANEQIGLTTMHTLFMREHNWWASIFRAVLPVLNDDELYELARAMVAAEMQAITYNEFLPLLLGPDSLEPYTGYKPEVNASIANVFSTAAYRVGHTMLSNTLLRLRRDGRPIPIGNIPLAGAFFNPDAFAESGLAPILRGLASQPAQEIDNQIVGAVRNFLFGPPGSGGFDLASLNIQRGRDHGLPGYNQVRVDYGLAPFASFADVNPDPQVQANLAAVYDSVDDIDIWVGGLAEPHVEGALVGETFHAILSDQFQRLRDGDRFFYRSYLPEPFLTLVEDSTLARIIRRNTAIGNELQDDVFRLPGN